MDVGMYSRFKGMENVFIVLYVEVYYFDLEFQKMVVVGLVLE